MLKSIFTEKELFKSIITIAVSVVLIGCISYRFLAFHSTLAGEVADRLPSASDKVTDICISGIMGQEDVQALTELALQSDILTRIDLSQSNAILPHHAFAGCSFLVDVKLPKLSMTMVPPHCFSGCTNLIAVLLPAACASVEESAFSNCRNLTSICLPETVEFVKKDVFKGCESLKTFTCKAKVPPACEKNALSGISTSCKLWVPKGTSSLYRNAIGWEKFSLIEEYKQEKRQ